jgi:CRP-like cAMP-binding protein
MDDKLRSSDFIEKLFGFALTERVIELIDLHSFIVTFPAGHTVIREGEKAHYCYFILKGVVRGYYIDMQGNDITKCFCSENEFFSSEGLRTEEGYSCTIECLEDCKCIQFPYKLIHQLSMEDKRLKAFIDQLYYNEVDKLDNRIKKFMLMSAEERYNDFCEYYPFLQNRIALKYIASYIGVRSASLSRIRKNLQKTAP